MGNKYKFKSKFGFLLPNSRQSQSENGVLFSVEEMLLIEHKPLLSQ